MKQLPYRVFVGGERTATFIDPGDATEYAARHSSRHPVDVEVQNSDGAIRRYQAGVMVPAPAETIHDRND